MARESLTGRLAGGHAAFPRLIVLICMEKKFSELYAVASIDLQKNAFIFGVYSHNFQQRLCCGAGFALQPPAGTMEPPRGEE
jgi:hypothetical protein